MNAIHLIEMVERLKTQEWKTRHHQKRKVGKRASEKSGTRSQGQKTWESGNERHCLHPYRSKYLTPEVTFRHEYFIATNT